LIVEGAADAIEFYKRAFGAHDMGRMQMPGSKALMHAAMKFGDSWIFLVDAMEEWGVKGPKGLGGSSVTIHLFVPDVDKAFRRALDAGCTETMAVADMFWGDRYGKVKDPFGHDWSLATHIRDMSPQEMETAMKAAFAAGKPDN
ncbi:MAG: VOC family protein, partial [Alphaproteobacteria bacterium]